MGTVSLDRVRWERRSNFNEAPLPFAVAILSHNARPLAASRWLMAAADSGEEGRQCIRALVTVIRQAQQGSSPVDDGQLAHMRKVVRLLSLSEEQIADMQPSDRETVTRIRQSAISKMKLAKAVGSCDGSVRPFGGASAPPPVNHLQEIQAMQTGTPPPSAAHSCGNSPPLSSSLPSTSTAPPFGGMPGSMAPPSFYTRKSR